MLRCFDLPEDVIEKILYWLPVKSLIRFTCVSKRWRSLISDPHFVKSHLHLALQNGTLHRRILVSAGDFDSISVRPSTLFQSIGDDSSVTNLTYPTDQNLQLNILGSCHGLVLLADPTAIDFQSLLIWNPSTRFSFKISHLPVRVSCYASIGYDSGTDDYKVVIIPHFRTREAGSSAHVYSLREKIWRAVEIPPWLELYTWSSDSGTFSNGAMHWVISVKPEMTERVIYAFDLEKEVFHRVPFPKLIQNDIDKYGILIRTQIYLGGCLCISSADDNYLDEHVEFWIMTEYGVAETWVKLFNFSLSYLPVIHADLSCRIVFVTERSAVFMREGDKLEIFKIEFSKEGQLCISEYGLEQEIHTSSVYLVTVYDETLVSIPE